MAAFIMVKIAIAISVSLFLIPLITTDARSGKRPPTRRIASWISGTSGYRRDLIKIFMAIQMEC